MRKRIGLAAIVAVLAVVAVLFAVGGVKLSDFTTQLAVGLTLMIPFITAFMIKPEIDKRLHKKQRLSMQTSLPMTSQNPTLQMHKIQFDEKSIAHPSIKNGIEHYQNRSQLPFGEMISRAERKVEMSAITFRITTLSNYNILKGVLSRKVRLTLLLLSPDSSSLLIQSEIYHGSEDLKEQIQKSLGILCTLKTNFNDLVDIRFYDTISENSIVIIDRDNPDKAWIQVENRPVGSDSNSRPLDAAYRKENQDFFNQYSMEYDALSNGSKIHECSSSTS